MPRSAWMSSIRSLLPSRSSTLAVDTSACALCEEGMMPERAKRLMSAKRITLVTFVAAALVYALFIWQRRWMSDDGLIYLRTVRNILDGNGPVFNAFERAESNTSVLWVWLLAALGSMTGHLSPLAVFTGGVLS